MIIRNKKFHSTELRVIVLKEYLSNEELIMMISEPLTSKSNVDSVEVYILNVDWNKNYIYTIEVKVNYK